MNTKTKSAKSTMSPEELERFGYEKVPGARFYRSGRLPKSYIVGQEPTPSEFIEHVFQAGETFGRSETRRTIRTALGIAE